MLLRPTLNSELLVMRERLPGEGMGGDAASVSTPGSAEGDAQCGDAAMPL
jgi:hypothetical protein